MDLILIYNKHSKDSGKSYNFKICYFLREIKNDILKQIIFI